jgi:hypothetical protein
MPNKRLPLFSNWRQNVPREIEGLATLGTSPSQQPIKREGPRPTQYQRGQARKIEQVRLVARLSEVSSGRGHQASRRDGKRWEQLDWLMLDTLRADCGEGTDPRQCILQFLGRGTPTPTGGRIDLEPAGSSGSFAIFTVSVLRT